MAWIYFSKPNLCILKMYSLIKCPLFVLRLKYFSTNFSAFVIPYTENVFYHQFYQNVYTLVSIYRARVNISFETPANQGPTSRSTQTIHSRTILHKTPHRRSF